MTINDQEVTFTDFLKLKTAEEWAENDKEVQEWEKKRDRLIIDSNFQKCGASRHYLVNVGFDKFRLPSDPAQKRNLEIFRNIGKSFVNKILAGENCNFIMCGPSGVGKTFLALSMLKEVCEVKKDLPEYPKEWGVYAYRSGIYRTSDYLCEEVKQSTSFNSKWNKFKLIDYYSNSDLLIIDEIGRADYKNEKDVLFSVLDRRYQEGKPSILITNKNEAELKKHLDEALCSRLYADCIVYNENHFANFPNMRNCK